MKRFLLACIVALGMSAHAQISLGSGTSTGVMPISSNYGYNYTQQIFTKNELNAVAAGNITGVKFYLGATSSIANSTTWKVYIGHTTKTSFSSTSDWIPVASLTPVYDAEVANNSGEVTVTFTTPFAYNNTDNLVIAVDENKPDFDGGNYFYTFSGVSNSSIYYRSDTNNPDPTGTLPTATSRTSTKSRITFLGLSPNVPVCPVVSAPAAAATNVSVTPTITWAAAATASSYKISLGTTPGGTNVMNMVDVGNVTTYTLQTALSYNTQYYLTVYATNATGTSSGCTERSFTTGGITCPSVSSPANNATNAPLQPTITWAVSPGAAGYRLTVGTATGGTDVLNNVDLGNVTSYTFSSALALGTDYYYTVNAYGGGLTSSSCTERKFTITATTPVANDECVGAITLTPGGTFDQNAITATNVNSTSSSPGTCQTSSNNNVWYKVVVPASGNITLETKAVTGSTFTDTVMSAYSGTCGALTLLQCNDDNPAGGLYSIISLTNQTPGATIYVSVWKYTGNSSVTDGEFKISAYDSSIVLATNDVRSEAKNNIKVYPNPFSDVLNISDIANVKNVIVTDVSGRLVKTVANPASSLQLGELKQGMYLVTLEMKDGSKQTIKTIKK
ncbi:T9SS type A sorting domain-containing protein [Chryseobacterium sp. MMS23-Vi53]|uniref:T9SS type A sorting domain-containing protein n=1 Tax=Chryseobacterium sp. MMS23-Vi53 TaxID=3386644 RepID=UPI0039EC0D52